VGVANALTQIEEKIAAEKKSRNGDGSGVPP